MSFIKVDAILEHTEAIDAKRAEQMASVFCELANLNSVVVKDADRNVWVWVRE